MKIKLLKDNELIIDKIDSYKISLAETYLNNEFHLKTKELTKNEIAKKTTRTEIINFILSKRSNLKSYLEIGVRRRIDNFDKIVADIKYSVDPGIEDEVNDVDFKVTSDEFFSGLNNGNYLNKDIRFDVIFIDGLHLAEQVEKDINNSLKFLKDDGFLVLHDCNPPTEFHASENYYYRLSPAEDYWNGTTWKSFFKNRLRKDISSCCIDTDWGVGVISKRINLGETSEVQNPFFEFYILNNNRKDSLNLMSFEEFKSLI